MNFDIFVIIFIAFLGYNGFRKGLVATVLRIVSFIVSLALAWLAYPYITQFFGANPVMNLVILIALFLICRVIFGIAAKLLKSITSLPILKQLDRLGGLAFGLLQGFVIIFGILAIISFTASFGDGMFQILSPGAYDGFFDILAKFSFTQMLYYNNIILNYFIK